MSQVESAISKIISDLWSFFMQGQVTKKSSVMLNVSSSLIPFLGYSGWSKNWIDMRQINRKKSRLIMSV